MEMIVTFKSWILLILLKFVDLQVFWLVNTSSRKMSLHAHGMICVPGVIDVAPELLHGNNIWLRRVYGYAY